MPDYPHISVNLAISADGKISNENHRPSGWTSREDYDRLLELRRPADALLVGRGTLVSDNMSLTVPNQPRQPLRCIASRKGIFTGKESVFHTAGGDIHILCDEPPNLNQSLPATWHTGGLAHFLATLKQHHGVQHLHCEGGGELMQALFALEVVKTIHLTWAMHRIFGGQNSPTLTGLGPFALKMSQRYQLIEIRPTACGTEMFLTLISKNHTP